MGGTRLADPRDAQDVRAYLEYRRAPILRAARWLSLALTAYLSTWLVIRAIQGRWTHVLWDSVATCVLVLAYRGDRRRLRLLRQTGTANGWT